ncbi:MAG: DUF1415 domain-containing protein [Bacteroidota bacterium]
MKDTYLLETQNWVQGFVLKHNLCPFAHTPARKGQIRYSLSEAKTENELLDDLKKELGLLVTKPPEELETTLLIHPFVLDDFYDYNDFLYPADLLLEELDLVGEIQIASFHPNYQFAGTTPNDVTNRTNRSPYPMLHLIREESITHALENYVGDPSQIPERNQAKMRELS